MILKAYKYRIYPTKKQQALFARFFGCARFVWNFFLTMRTQEYQQHYVTVSEYTCKKELTRLKAEPGFEWLNECDSTSLQAVTELLQKAFEKFWAGDAITVPADAKSGETIHIILRAVDAGGTNPAAYQRVIITVQ